jgi:imidazolonepropionase-like amidohydrolase
VKLSVLKILIGMIFLCCVLSYGQRSYVLEGARIFDGVQNRILEEKVIVVDGGLITGIGRKNEVIIPSNAKRINVTGKFIMPGLIDAHAHYESPRDLLQMLAWGVTSVNCMFESTSQALEMEQRTASATDKSPQIYAMAPIFTAKGGWWDEGFPTDSAINRFPSTPEEAREQIRKVKATGIKRVKLMYDSMRWCRDSLPPLKKMDPGVMKALLDEAKKQKLFTAVHAPVLSDAHEVLNAGAASFAHGIIDEYLDPTFVERMQYLNVFYTPTFCLYEFLADVEGFMKHALSDKRFRSALPSAMLKRYSSKEYFDQYRKRYPNIEFVKSHLSVLRNSVSTLLSNYSPFAMGTDMWALPGIGAHLELEYLVKAGMNTHQALACATYGGSDFLGASKKIGTIETGKQADLLVLDANPLEDIRNTRSIRTIIKHGKMFDHQKLIKESKR